MPEAFEQSLRELDRSCRGLVRAKPVTDPFGEKDWFRPWPKICEGERGGERVEASRFGLGGTGTGTGEGEAFCLVHDVVRCPAR